MSRRRLFRSSFMRISFFIDNTQRSIDNLNHGNCVIGISQHALIERAATSPALLPGLPVHGIVSRSDIDSQSAVPNAARVEVAKRP